MDVIKAGNYQMMIALFITSVLAQIPFPANASVPDDYWRNPRRCGTNCLYAYIKLHNQPVSLAMIINMVPIGQDGSNMADLRKAATSLGVPSSVIKTNPSQLSKFALPAIAHVQHREGHFVLILQVTPETVVTSDMLGGHVETMPSDVFFEHWSGHLLVPDTTYKWPWIYKLALVIVSCGGIYIVACVVNATLFKSINKKANI